MAGTTSGNITAPPASVAPPVGNNPFQSASLYVGDLANEISEVCVTDAEGFIVSSFLISSLLGVII
jgi:hypothetical protein